LLRLHFPDGAGGEPRLAPGDADPGEGGGFLPFSVVQGRLDWSWDWRQAADDLGLPGLRHSVETRPQSHQTAGGSRASLRAQVASGANHLAQHVPTFVPRLAGIAMSQRFEVPNSVLSHNT
jgi:hypothetical protein